MIETHYGLIAEKFMFWEKQQQICDLAVVFGSFANYVLSVTKLLFVYVAIFFIS